jgi:hypothetical protein
VSHACNPIYSRGRNWKDWSLRPALAKGLWDHISTNEIWVMWRSPVIPVMWEAKRGRSWSRPAEAKM